MSEAPIGSQAAFGEDELDEDEARRDWLRVAARDELRGWESGDSDA